MKTVLSNVSNFPDKFPLFFGLLVLDDDGVVPLPDKPEQLVLDSVGDVAPSPSSGPGHVSDPVPEPGLLLDVGGGHTGTVFLSITGFPDILDAVVVLTDSVLDKDDDDKPSFFLTSLSSLIFLLTPLYFVEDDDVDDEEKEEHSFLVAEDDLVAEVGDADDTTCLSSSSPMKSSFCRVSCG